jgi:hypothetical protein
MGLKFGLYVSYTQWKAYHTRLKISPYGGSLIKNTYVCFCEFIVPWVHHTKNLFQYLIAN